MEGFEQWSNSMDASKWFNDHLGGGFKYISKFTPKLGEDGPNLTCAIFFHMGW